MDYIKRYNVFAIFSVIICILAMICYPLKIASSAKDGFAMWSGSIFPTLFPFFVGINMLVDLGFAKFMGEILSPIMIPLFGISGIGSFPLFSGVMSGYPVGAKTTTLLYESNKLNKKEAQRLLGISNNCGPLFIIGVVGGYIFKNVVVGYYILFVHILSAIVFGIALNIIVGNVNDKKIYKKNYVREAFKQMRLHTKDNNKTFGKILSDSVEGAIKSSLGVLGFVVLFSVFGTIIEMLHIHEVIIFFVNNLLNFGINEKVIEGIFLGSIEMTAGLFLIDGNINITNIIAAVFILTFGGFSVHAQSISFISKTDLNSGKYIFDKFLCSLISVVIVFVTYPFIVRIPFLSINSVNTEMLYNTLNIYAISALIVVCCIVVCYKFKRKRALY